MPKKRSRSKIVLLLLLSGSILAIACIYLFIPSTINISEVIYLRATPGGAIRTLSNNKKWNEWWPKKNTGQGALTYNGFNYQLYKTDIDIAGIIVQSDKGGKDSIYSTITSLPLSVDSTALQWKCSIKSSNNPIDRIQQYSKARTLKNNMTRLFDQLQAYLEKEDNIYGVHIQQSMVKDTVLITTVMNTKTFPQPQDINPLINKLRSYASSQGANEMNFPMLHIRRTDSTNFECMVALSVSKTLKETADIKLRRMVPGKILVGQVSGGRSKINEAWQQMEYYLHDHRLIPPAKPFESLVTDRVNEPDTSKWVTKIYYPVW